MLQDLRYAVRALRRSSGFAVTAIVTLALSVALGTSLFATVDAIFFRTLPVHAPEELVYLYWTPIQGPSRPFPIPRAHFEHLKDTPEAFSAVAGHLMWSGRVNIGGAAETLHGELVTANYFGVLGVQPMLGRAFLPEEDTRGSAGSDLVVLIGHDLWTRRFAASPDVLGKTMTVTHQDPRADVYRIQSVTQMLGELLYSRRLATAVLGGGAVIAMVLALVGLYAVVSYSVSRRVHELGVRAVLGADRATLIWFVTREALIVAAAGCVLGFALAHAAVRTTASFFEGMPRLDGLTASAMLLMLGTLVGIAAYVPARHAARIDPTEALRAL